MSFVSPWDRSFKPNIRTIIKSILSRLILFFGAETSDKQSMMNSSKTLERQELARLKYLLFVGSLCNFVWPLLTNTGEAEGGTPFAINSALSIVTLLGWLLSFKRNISVHFIRQLCLSIGWALVIRIAYDTLTISDNLKSLLSMLLIIPVMMSYAESRVSLLWYTLLLSGIALSMSASAHYKWHMGGEFMALSLLSAILIGGMLSKSRIDAFRFLKARESNQSTMLESMTEGLLMQDAQRKIVSMNAAAMKILNLREIDFGTVPHLLTVREDLSRFPNEELPPIVSLKIGMPIYNCLVGVKTSLADRTGTAPELKWLHVTSIPTFDKSEDTISPNIPTGVLTTFIDVTEIRKAHQDLIDQQAMVAHTAKLGALGEMAGGIAHEINNPLTVINGHIHQMRRRLAADNPAVAENYIGLVDKVQNGIDRIQRVVKGMTSLSRSGEHDPLVALSIPTIISETLDISRDRIHRDSIALELSIHQDMSVNGQASQLQQVILNLLNNAVDALKDSDKRWIKVSTEACLEKVRIIIEDSGPGIPLELRTKIMQPFFTTKEVGKGTGLGLSISRKIMEKHQGRLYLDDKASSTRFIIELPRVQPSA